LEQFAQNPDGVSAQEMDDLLEEVQKQKASCTQLAEGSERLAQDIRERLNVLNELLKESTHKKDVHSEIDGLKNLAEEGFSNLSSVLDTVPDQINKMLQTL